MSNTSIKCINELISWIPYPPYLLIHNQCISPEIAETHRKISGLTFPVHYDCFTHVVSLKCSQNSDADWLFQLRPIITIILRICMTCRHIGLWWKLSSNIWLSILSKKITNKWSLWCERSAHLTTWCRTWWLYECLKLVMFWIDTSCHITISWFRFDI